MELAFYRRDSWLAQLLAARMRIDSNRGRFSAFLTFRRRKTHVLQAHRDISNLSQLQHAEKNDFFKRRNVFSERFRRDIRHPALGDLYALMRLRTILFINS